MTTEHQLARDKELEGKHDQQNKASDSEIPCLTSIIPWLTIICTISNGLFPSGEPSSKPRCLRRVRFNLMWQAAQLGHRCTFQFHGAEIESWKRTYSIYCCHSAIEAGGYLWNVGIKVHVFDRVECSGVYVSDCVFWRELSCAKMAVDSGVMLQVLLTVLVHLLHPKTCQNSN